MTVRTLILSVVTLIWAGCRKPAPATPTPPPPVTVSVARAVAEDLPAYIAVSGTVRPVQRAVVASKVMAVVEHIPIALGQRVAAGEVLAQLAASDLAARVNQATTQHEQAKRDFERDARLASGGALIEDAVRIARDRVALTRAALEEARVNHGYATLRASFSGVVSRRYRYAGDLAIPGQPLLELEGTDAFEVEVPVPDSLAARLSIGATLHIVFPVGHVELDGAITELSSSAESAARSVTAKIALPTGPPVRSGEFVHVQLPGESARVILVPTRCVSPFGQMQRVFVLSPDGRAALRLVKTGAVRSDRTEIVSGLEGDETLVLDATTPLVDGQAVIIHP